MARKNKYNNKKVTYFGLTFDSQAEGNRYLVLRDMEASGQINKLELQPRFDMIVNGKFCGFYKADFAYFTENERVIEDVKGMKTPVYNLKKKIVEAMYGIKITEIKSK